MKKEDRGRFREAKFEAEIVGLAELVNDASNIAPRNHRKYSASRARDSRAAAWIRFPRLSGQYCWPSLTSSGQTDNFRLEFRLAKPRAVFFFHPTSMPPLRLKNRIRPSHAHSSRSRGPLAQRTGRRRRDAYK